MCSKTQAIASNQGRPTVTPTSCYAIFEEPAVCFRKTLQVFENIKPVDTAPAPLSVATPTLSATRLPTALRPPSTLKCLLSRRRHYQRLMLDNSTVHSTVLKADSLTLLHQREPHRVFAEPPPSTKATHHRRHQPRF